MSNLAPPQQLVAIAGALVWPLAAGLGVVFWSKARAAAQARKLAAMDGRLRGLYRELEGRAPPAQLALAVEALEEGEALSASRQQPAASDSGTAVKPARSEG